MKHFIIRALHSIIGFKNYLFIFTIFKIYTLRLDKRKREYLYFTTLFPQNANIVVIGANTGITTIPVAKKVKKGKVFAIEPVPDNFLTLKKIIGYYKLKNIEPINLALGSENKDIEMVMPIVNATRSQGLCYVEDENIAGYRQGIKFKVQMKKLDEVFSSFKDKIDGIKIVAENYERFIFEGGRKIIAMNRPTIYCELWFNENRIKTLNLIESMNYEIRILENNKLINFNPDKHYTKNFFFIPKK